MRLQRLPRSARRRLLALAIGLAPLAAAMAQPDFSGVWGMVQHDRLGAPFFIPVEPKLNATGKAVTDAFVAKYDVENLEANGSCVEPGMPTVMWGIGGAAMEIVQQPQRITLLSELANQSRRIYLDGREPPEDSPDQRVGYSIGRWEGDTLVIETTRVTEWQAPRWPHSDEFRVTERWFFKDASELTITGLRPERPPKVEGQVLINEMTMNDREVVRRHGLQGHGRLPAPRGSGHARGRLRRRHLDGSARENVAARAALWPASKSQVTAIASRPLSTPSTMSSSPPAAKSCT